MARSINQKANTTSPNSVYPFGDIKDDSGQNDGTPVNRSVYADFHQFFEKLMNSAGTVANGLPDNADNGFQLFEAFNTIKTDSDKYSNGVFGFDSEIITDSSAVSFRHKITASEDFIYALIDDNGVVTVKQYFKETFVQSGTIPPFVGTAKDLFFDAISGNLYMLVDNGGNAGYLVYNEQLVYQSLLSVPSTAKTFEPLGICVTEGRVLMVGQNGSDKGVAIGYNKQTNSFIREYISSADARFKSVYGNVNDSFESYLDNLNSKYYSIIQQSVTLGVRIIDSFEPYVDVLHYDVNANKNYSFYRYPSLDAIVQENTLNGDVDSGSYFSLVITSSPSDITIFNNEMYLIDEIGSIFKYTRS